jgi:hypothetical protein
MIKIFLYISPENGGSTFLQNVGNHFKATCVMTKKTTINIFATMRNSNFICIQFVFWVVTPCELAGRYQHLEEHTVSIFSTLTIGLDNIYHIHLHNFV